MTATVEGERTLLAIPARLAAMGWMNAFLAAGSDEKRPALYRTLSLEFFEHGLHVVGCDGAVLFRCWVPTDEDRKAWPDDAEAPQQSVVVMDPDGFGLGFMRALLRVTGDEEHALDKLSITTAEADDESSPALGDEFLSERVILRACGQRIDLRTFEGGYPNWRQLKLGLQDVERMDEMTVGSRILGLFGKLKGVFRVNLVFHGKRRFIGFVASGIDYEVRGALMPMARREEKAPKSKHQDDEDGEE